MLVLFHQEDKFTDLQTDFEKLNSTISASLSEIWPPQQNAADSLVSDSFGYIPLCSVPTAVSQKGTRFPVIIFLAHLCLCTLGS